MLRKVITYLDYNDVERTETFYFNLSEAELSLMELKTPGGLKEKLQRISDSKNGAEIIGFFEDFIDICYGKKSDDGLHFWKSQEIVNDFKSTQAYHTMLLELLTDSAKAALFVNGVLPEKMSQILESN